MELLTGDPEMEEEQEARFAKETAAAVEDAIAISADSVWRLAMDLLLCLLLLSVFFFLLQSLPCFLSLSFLFSLPCFLSVSIYLFSPLVSFSLSFPISYKT